jgi:hypothetical protein
MLGSVWLGCVDYHSFYHSLHATLGTPSWALAGSLLKHSEGVGVFLRLGLAWCGENLVRNLKA